MTSRGVRGCVYIAVVFVRVRLETQHQRTTAGFCTNEQSSFSGLDPDQLKNAAVTAKCINSP